MPKAWTIYLLPKFSLSFAPTGYKYCFIWTFSFMLAVLLQWAPLFHSGVMPSPSSVFPRLLSSAWRETLRRTLVSLILPQNLSLTSITSIILKGAIYICIFPTDTFVSIITEVFIRLFLLYIYLSCLYWWLSAWHSIQNIFSLNISRLCVPKKLATAHSMCIMDRVFWIFEIVNRMTGRACFWEMCSVSAREHLLSTS